MKKEKENKEVMAGQERKEIVRMCGGEWLGRWAKWDTKKKTSIAREHFTYFKSNQVQITIH